MAHNFSFKTEAIVGDACYYRPIGSDSWDLGICRNLVANLRGEDVDLSYLMEKEFSKDFYGLDKARVANKEAFNEWRSRLIDVAVQKFKFKGNVDNVFGPPAYNELIPLYLEGTSPSTAYMASLGLLENDFNDE